MFTPADLSPLPLPHVSVPYHPSFDPFRLCVGEWSGSKSGVEVLS